MLASNRPDATSGYVATSGYDVAANGYVVYKPTNLRTSNLKIYVKPISTPNVGGGGINPGATPQKTARGRPKGGFLAFLPGLPVRSGPIDVKVSSVAGRVFYVKIIIFGARRAFGAAK